MDSARINRLYMERLQTVLKSCHEDGMRPRFGVVEILLMAGMTRPEAELAVMLSDGLGMAEIYAAFRGSLEMYDLACMIDRYGSKKKLRDLVDNAEILIIWLSNMELVGREGQQ